MLRCQGIAGRFRMCVQFHKGTPKFLPNLTERSAEQTDELVADRMFEVFANERAVKEFVAKDRTLAQKVFDHIKSLINDIKAIYKSLYQRDSMMILPHDRKIWMLFKRLTI